MRYIATIVLFFFVNLPAPLAQDSLGTFVKGVVWGVNEQGKKEALAGANLRWLGTNQGGVTNAKGYFKLNRIEGANRLVVSYIAYIPDTILLADQSYLEIVLKQGIELEKAEVVYRRKSTVVSHSATIHTETLGHGELSKAACCNLSESFETSPSVDVSFTDAVTGTKQIRMLGLAGPYSQLTRENMPDIRGLSAINGMEFIPGPWISSIQLIKGAGSVVNGYESIAGQINTELYRSANMPDFFLNMYINNDQQLEVNTHFKHSIGKSWMNAVFIHGRYSQFRRDMNRDGFADKPANQRIIVMDRLEWVNDKNIHFELGGRYIFHNQLGGQTAFDPDEERDTLHPWGMTSVVKKADAWLKLGRINPLRPWQSTAIQLSSSLYHQDASFGLRDYAGREESFYANLLHKGQLGSEKHLFTLGASFLYDRIDEQFVSDQYLRTEIVPGVFGEYSFIPQPAFSLVGGLRFDYHNQFGAFITPRLHGRWEILPKVVMRFSAGRGFRTGNIFSEHMSMLASNREIIIHSDNTYGYGLKPEIAWNYGLNLTWTFELDYREAIVGASFYRSDFINQMVFDIDRSYQEVHFYNLDGRSFANSFQIQMDYELIKRLDIRLAYRFYDVQSTFSGVLKEVPLVSRHRGFVNLAYETRSSWKFDATLNRVGMKRIPTHILSKDQGDYSPSYFVINAQITKVFREVLDVYLGVENLNNFRQNDPIILVNQAHQKGFDASLVWGPIWGQHLYLGFRWKWNK